MCKHRHHHVCFVNVHLSKYFTTTNFADHLLPLVAAKAKYTVMYNPANISPVGEC